MMVPGLVPLLDESQLPGPFVAGIATIGSNEFPGRMTLSTSMELVLIFDFNSLSTSTLSQIRINLVGLLETKIIPDPVAFLAPAASDPSTLPACLLVTYLEDMFDNSSIVTIYFSGIHSEVDAIRAKTDAISRELKNRLLFEGPVASPPKGTGQPNPAKRMASTFKILAGPSAFLADSDISQIRLALPFRMRTLSWDRTYVASVEGVSLRALYRRTEKKMPLLLVILTDDKTRIGVFLPSGLKIVKGFYGSGETFVFRFAPLIEVFKWSQKNDLFCTASETEIVIGGGSGAALFINEAMLKGVSTTCETFDSVPLAAKETFGILDLECWHLHH
jgi:hypothetical protein